ncbi:MAG: hypothetical protein A2286_13955 [Gammaproteobacteria bacterium RIFOXYA12_FULL_61_12]|nr:MAG: hypothetical protein A2286_13955 [Gammaproteobacteria bacterium RIFOXYA12_FULL_61_12]OGT90314.1 MAG: hypothetical protein A2514_14050 [Gammaproteobacteria bacterium RIFOXYD12_FULL_61_37]
MPGHAYHVTCRCCGDTRPGPAPRHHARWTAYHGQGLGSLAGVFYAPSLIFFDERGKEIIRVDSVVRFFRLNNLLRYISSRGYLDEPSYLRWRMTRGARP